jgi:abortive infection bacteriophage resistance protein
MGKKATTIEEQIQILKDRGMSFSFSEEKVKELLIDIGYYRLGFYWNPFEIDKNHNFKTGSSFENVIKLYYFDVDLRNILTRYLIRIEINFKSKLIYYVSNEYKDLPTWFADESVMNQNFIDGISNLYNTKFIRNNKAIKKHHEKYTEDKFAPAWKTLEFFTFGAALTIFKNLNNQDLKVKIANKFGVLNVEKFKNLMETMVLIRNFCVHGDVLFDLRTPKGIATIPDIKFNKDDRNSLIACIKVILFFLEKISKNRKSDLEKELKILFDSLTSVEDLDEIVFQKMKISKNFLEN